MQSLHHDVRTVDAMVFKAHCYKTARMFWVAASLFDDFYFILI